MLNFEEILLNAFISTWPIYFVNDQGIIATMRKGSFLTPKYYFEVLVAEEKTTTI